MNDSFFILCGKELKRLPSDPWLLSLVSWIPLLLFVVMWLIFSQGVAVNIPLGVVDLDNSAMSRALTRQYDASPELTVKANFISIKDGEEALRAGQIYGLAIFPQGFERDAIRGNPPQVTAFFNSQYLLIGKVINSALLVSQTNFSTRLEVAKNMAGPTPVFDMALSTAMPIGSQITPLFNTNKDYGQFLLAAILPAIWQIIMVTASILSLAKEQREQGITAWLGRAPYLSVLAKMLVLGVFFFLQGVLFLSLMFAFLHWPMHGSWKILIGAQMATILASLSISFVIFFLFRDPARCLSIAAAYVAPALAFMGVTFPVTDMTMPAKIWRSLLPISHYIEIQSGQVNHAVALKNAAPQFGALSLFILLIIFVFFLTKKASGQQTTTGKESLT